MGTYTELVIKCQIKEKTPKKVVAILDSLFGSGEEFEGSLPKHQFFLTDSYSLVGSMDSFYHIPKVLSFFDGTYLFCRSDFKDYHNLIDQFVDWLSPYIEGESGDHIGYKWVENCSPEWLYKD